jgi:hypothetical protein
MVKRIADYVKLSLHCISLLTRSNSPSELERNSRVINNITNKFIDNGFVEEK